MLGEGQRAQQKGWGGIGSGCRGEGKPVPSSWDGSCGGKGRGWEGKH